MPLLNASSISSLTFNSSFLQVSWFVLYNSYVVFSLLRSLVAVLFPRLIRKYPAIAIIAVIDMPAISAIVSMLGGFSVGFVGLVVCVFAGVLVVIDVGFVEELGIIGWVCDGVWVGEFVCVAPVGEKICIRLLALSAMYTFPFLFIAIP